MAQPILQFGTSRFMQAHVDFFVSEALNGAAGAGDALGGITVVQSTSSAASTARTQALAAGGGYPVRIRGLTGGERIDTTVQCTAVREALHAATHWTQLRHTVARDVQVVTNLALAQGLLGEAHITRVVLDEQDLDRLTTNHGFSTGKVNEIVDPVPGTDAIEIWPP